MPTRDTAAWVLDARQRSLDLAADLDHEQLLGPRLAIVNPLLWEIGHVAWFQEKWVLRHVCQQKPVRKDADLLYDSIAIAHDIRWDLPLPGSTLPCPTSRKCATGYSRCLNETPRPQS